MVVVVVVVVVIVIVIVDASFVLHSRSNFNFRRLVLLFWLSVSAVYMYMKQFGCYLVSGCALLDSQVINRLSDSGSIDRLLV